jgi:hypothetical protein
MELSPPPPPITSPPGWYPDPAGYGQRYWDGRVWSEHVAPAPAMLPQADRSAPVGDWIGGVLISVLFPIVGLIAGVVYVTRGGAKRDVGLLCIVLSAICFFFWVAMLSSGSSGGY